MPCFACWSVIQPMHMPAGEISHKKNFSGSNWLGPMKIGPKSKVVQARQGVYIYKLNSRDSSPTYQASAVSSFMLFFSFSNFSDRWSLN